GDLAAKLLLAALRVAPTSLPSSPDAGPTCHRLDTFASGSPDPPSPARTRNRAAAGAMSGGGLAAAWELAVVFLIRPLLAVVFVFTLILLSWYVAWRTVLVHVPLVQEIAGLRPKKATKPKPANRGRFAKFYQSQAEAAAQRNSKSEGSS
ncbi:unnamed protein product, partial [Urochloa humidicola]